MDTKQMTFIGAITFFVKRVFLMFVGIVDAADKGVFMLNEFTNEAARQQSKELAAKDIEDVTIGNARLTAKLADTQVAIDQKRSKDEAFKKAYDELAPQVNAAVNARLARLKAYNERF